MGLILSPCKQVFPHRGERQQGKLRMSWQLLRHPSILSPTHDFPRSRHLPAQAESLLQIKQGKCTGEDSVVLLLTALPGRNGPWEVAQLMPVHPCVSTTSLRKPHRILRIGWGVASCPLLAAGRKMIVLYVARWVINSNPLEISRVC